MSPSHHARPIPTDSLRWRPTSYFGALDTEAEIQTGVKGTARRQWLQRALDNGTLSEMPEELRQGALDEDSRQLLGRIHPLLMGGEYLSHQRSGEVEIARISIRSTARDVTSVFARRVGRRIAYRVVDEYGGDTLSRVSQRTSVQPLTLGSLVDFFLSALTNTG